MSGSRKETSPAQRVTAAAEKLLNRLEQAVRELDHGTVTERTKTKTEDGTEVLREIVKPTKEKGAVDRGGLKQLTGVLKDLQDILSENPELTNKEREVKLQKLEQELNREPEAESVTVVMAEEAEGYAG